MEVGAGRSVQAEASKASAAIAVADQPAEAQRVGKEPAAKPTTKRKPGMPPSKKSAGTLSHNLIRRSLATLPQTGSARDTDLVRSFADRLERVQTRSAPSVRLLAFILDT